MERDEESGLNHHGARYLVEWLGRWFSADPIGIGSQINLYCYCNNNPIRISDPNGMDPALPPDAVVTQSNGGKIVTTSAKVHRKAWTGFPMINKLVETRDESDPAHPKATRRLYKLDIINRGWIDVTNEASRGGDLSVEWNMPPLQGGAASSGGASRNPVGEALGEILVSEVPPSLIIPYVKDSILVEHFESTPPGENSYQHWANTIGRRWGATGERKTSYWLNKVVAVAGAGVEAAGGINNAALASKALRPLIIAPKPVSPSALGAGTIKTIVGKSASEIGEKIIEWGKSQSADQVAKTVRRAGDLTRSNVAKMVEAGLTKDWVQEQLSMYLEKIAKGGPPLKNQQLVPRINLMEKILRLWPK